jgi:hypothetical protein
MDNVIVLRDLIIVDVDDRAALAQHMHEASQDLAAAKSWLAIFRQHRDEASMRETEDALDQVANRLLLLECGFNS